jgi:hypothetical protein
MVQQLNPIAVVALMCEGWEWRPGDVDLDACSKRGIPVVSTNEGHPDVDSFTYCGNLVVQLLLDAGIEIYRSSILIVGQDKFAPMLAAWLQRLGAHVSVVNELSSVEARRELECADALLVADYVSQRPVIGTQGLISAKELSQVAPAIVVVQFAGELDGAGLVSSGVPHFPSTLVGAHRMSRTLASIGPRPVIDLHAGGMKVGQLASIRRRTGKAVEEEHLVYRGSPLGTVIQPTGA